MKSLESSKSLPFLLAPLSIFILLASILSLMGRNIWCGCGSPTLWSWEVFSSHNSQHVIDWYTFSHIEHGFLFFWLAGLVLHKAALKSRLLYIMILESAWEILENSSLIIERYRSATIMLNYYGDSIANSLSDLSACTLGFCLAARLPARATIMLAVVFELFTLAIIRDNLTLNILMLIWPIETIKQWQAAGL